MKQKTKCKPLKEFFDGENLLRVIITKSMNASKIAQFPFCLSNKAHHITWSTNEELNILSGHV